MVQSNTVSAAEHMRFAVAKFRPATLPATLVTRAALHERLTEGADQRLTVVVGSPGAGKSVLLSSWAGTREPGTTSWLSCDEADANPARFWAGFIEASQKMEPGFGADAADLLAMDGVASPDVIASIANDAAKLPAGAALIVDDFQTAAHAVGGTMTDLVERWPAEGAKLVLASRSDPPLRLHRLRMTDELCEIRDCDLRFSLEESSELLANFGVQIDPADLAPLHERCEGWAAAIQMAALSLRGTPDPAQTARALDVHRHALAEYFIDEVLEQQPPELVQFMLDTSVLEELTADACAAVTARQDALGLLRLIDTANLFLVALDDERTSFRYHHLVRQVLRAELRTRDRAREEALQLRAAEWFESTADSRRASRHFLAGHQVERALALLQGRILTSYLRDPAPPVPLDLSVIDPSALGDAPERLLALAGDLLLSGDVARAGEYLDLFEHTHQAAAPEPRLAARLAAMRSVRYALAGQPARSVEEAMAARAIQEGAQLTDEWVASALPTVLLHAYTWLEDYAAVEREAAGALAALQLPEPARAVMVPGAQAVAWFEAGQLAKAEKAAARAETQARRLGFSRHFFAVDYLRSLAGLALERQDLDTAEQLTEQALSISEHAQAILEFLTLLDRAAIWAARGEVRHALASVEAARLVAAGAGPVLLARADELEALLRLSLGDLQSAGELARGLPAARRSLLLARIALDSGDHRAAQGHLEAAPAADLAPRDALVRQILLAAAAIGRGDPATPAMVAAVLAAARRDGFVNTVVTVAPQVTCYLVEHSAQLRSDPFTDRLIGAALQARAARPETRRGSHGLVEPLTAAELRVLKLLPTSTYLGIADTLYISHNTVKTHLRSIYQKLGVTSRAQAIQRAVDLRLL